MAGKRIIGVLFIASVLFVHLAGESGCANIVPPEGGSKDTLPPNLRTVTPRDSTLKFNGNRITFTF
ncbi:MAG TPA: hypothetical protein VK644_03305, partial [Chitinophagaceae bacterium]|nr:hypothetical protein [Chitinophagaceae bacterium]